jgi:hypothetical protein
MGEQGVCQKGFIRNALILLQKSDKGRHLLDGMPSLRRYFVSRY